MPARSNIVRDLINVNIERKDFLWEIGHHRMPKEPYYKVHHRILCLFQGANEGKLHELQQQVNHQDEIIRNLQKLVEEKDKKIKDMGLEAWT